MSLAAALAATTRPNTRRTRLDEIWDALDGDDRAQLLDALRDPDISHADLARALRTLGHQVGQTTIGDARRSGWAKSKETS